jgi:hypothetical protein
MTVDDNGNQVSAGGGDASAASQTSIQANVGSDATKVVAVQGVTNGKVIPLMPMLMKNPKHRKNRPQNERNYENKQMN